MNWPVRPATRKDAGELAWLINIAGEGLPEYLWTGMAGPGETAMSVGTRRAAREEGGFSYRHCLVVQDDARLLGMILHYPLPDLYPIDNESSVPEVIVPLIELEAQAAGSWYINAVATHAAYRGRGIASSLLAAGEDAAREAGHQRISLIVAEENQAACRLYGKLGYEQKATRRIRPYPGCLHQGNWVLMLKSL